MGSFQDGENAQGTLIQNFREICVKNKELTIGR